jgi:hypothetical protein
VEALDIVMRNCLGTRARRFVTKSEGIRKRNLEIIRNSYSKCAKDLESRRSVTGFRILLIKLLSE